MFEVECRLALTNFRDATSKSRLLKLNLKDSLLRGHPSQFAGFLHVRRGEPARAFPRCQATGALKGSPMPPISRRAGAAGTRAKTRPGQQKKVAVFLLYGRVGCTGTALHFDCFLTMAIREDGSVQGMTLSFANPGSYARRRWGFVSAALVAMQKSCICGHYAIRP